MKKKAWLIVAVILVFIGCANCGCREKKKSDISDGHLWDKVIDSINYGYEYPDTIRVKPWVIKKKVSARDSALLGRIEYLTKKLKECEEYHNNSKQININGNTNSVHIKEINQ